MDSSSGGELGPSHATARASRSQQVRLRGSSRPKNRLRRGVARLKHTRAELPIQTSLSKSASPVCRSGGAAGRRLSAPFSSGPMTGVARHKISLTVLELFLWLVLTLALLDQIVRPLQTLTNVVGRAARGGLLISRTRSSSQRCPRRTGAGDQLARRYSDRTARADDRGDRAAAARGRGDRRAAVHLRSRSRPAAGERRRRTAVAAAGSALARRELPTNWS